MYGFLDWMESTHGILPGMVITSLTIGIGLPGIISDFVNRLFATFQELRDDNLISPMCFRTWTLKERLLKLVAEKQDGGIAPGTEDLDDHLRTHQESQFIWIPFLPGLV